jgi:hypothetical protein
MYLSGINDAQIYVNNVQIVWLKMQGYTLFVNTSQAGIYRVMRSMVIIGKVAARKADKIIVIPQ